MYPVSGNSSFMAMSSAFFAPAAFAAFFRSTSVLPGTTHTHYMLTRVGFKHQSFEHAVYILPQLACHMVGSEVVLIHFIRNQLVMHFSLVEQTGHIGLCHCCMFIFSHNYIAKIKDASGREAGHILKVNGFLRIRQKIIGEALREPPHTWALR